MKSDGQGAQRAVTGGPSNKSQLGRAMRSAKYYAKPARAPRATWRNCSDVPTFCHNAWESHSGELWKAWKKPDNTATNFT
eukprot:15480235-Alexandrium_andersonii.AAC.1